MPLGLIQMSWDRDTGLPEDVTVNTFHCDFPDLAASGDDIQGRMLDFYNATYGSATVSQFLSSSLTGTGRCKIYDLTDPEPRVPVHDETFTGVSVGGTAYPDEVALCLSFHGAFTSGTNPAHRRNRVYIGPLASAAGSGNPCRPVDTFRTVLTAAAGALLAGFATDGGEWVAYSPTLNAGVAVIGGWVDNAFDTQRRRGVASTNRMLWPA